MPHMVYFYQLHTTNSYGETTSDLLTFTTSEAGQYNNIHCYLLPSLLKLFYIFIEPSSAPENFTVVELTSDSMVISWDPLPSDAQNGIITSYNFTCQAEADVASFVMTYPAAGSYNISGFTPAATYICTVLAITAGGSGPSATLSVTMLDDGNN